MSDKQSTALVLFLILAFALYLNNTPSTNISGYSKLNEIIGILTAGFSKVSGVPGTAAPGTTASGTIGSQLPPLWGKQQIPGTINLPDGFSYSPSFVTDLNEYLKGQKANPGLYK
jgi:hypothetical protein